MQKEVIDEIPDETIFDKKREARELSLDKIPINK